jgi:hypothetical protein
MPRDVARWLRAFVLFCTAAFALPAYGDVPAPDRVGTMDEVPRQLRGVDVNERLGRALPKDRTTPSSSWWLPG